jgi:hypothetical protein
MSTCESMTDPRAKYSCRNQVAAERGLAAATIAALIGAGLGYGGAKVLKQDPAIGALVGLFVAGGVTAVMQYSNYLLEKANNDRLLAMDLLGSAVKEDIGWHRQTYAEINRDIKGAIGSVAGIEQKQRERQARLTDHAKELQKLYASIKGVAVGSDVFVKSAEYYGQVSDTVSERRGDPPMVTKRREVGEQVSILGREAVEQKRINLAALEYMHRRGVWQ